VENKKIFEIIIVLIVFLVLVGAGGWFVLNYKSLQKQTETKTVSAAPTNILPELLPDGFKTPEMTGIVRNETLELEGGGKKSEYFFDTTATQSELVPTYQDFFERKSFVSADPLKSNDRTELSYTRPGLRIFILMVNQPAATRVQVTAVELK